VNTKISYLYRDASNNKVPNECIVRGLLTEEQTKAILDCRAGDNFIPSQVGLPEKRFDRFDPEEDTCWFELYESSFDPTDAEATVDLSVDELVSHFLSKKNHWEIPLTPGFEQDFDVPAEPHVNAHHYQFESRLYFKDATFGLDVCSTAGHTQYPASSEESTEFDIAYASEDYLAQMNAIQSLAALEKDFDLHLEAVAVGWDEADRETVFASRLCSDNGSFSLQPTADMSDCIENIPLTEFQNAYAYAWGAFFSKVKELSPHELDAYRRFAGRAAFHDGAAGKEWLQKARNGELRSNLSDIIAKAQKTFEGIAKGEQPSIPESPER
jgi:hypothetical protein